MVISFAFLALAEPFGIGIAGVGLVGRSLFVSSKNERIVRTADEKRKEVTVAINMFQAPSAEIQRLVNSFYFS